MNIAFVSSSVPRKCGIASYTRDISLDIEKQKHNVSFIAMENPIVPTAYSSSVLEIIRQNVLSDYKKAARIINKSNIDIVHLQHEFGLFGGRNGEYVLEFAKQLKKPFVVTFHTALLLPKNQQKYIIQNLSEMSRSIIVMENIAKTRLKKIYKLQNEISVIMHGAPSIKISKLQAKRQIGLPNKFILLANNLLSRNKGIEYAIEAVAKSVKDIPNIIFLIVGETHPIVISKEGESYRKELIALVKKLKIERHVMFVNEYVSIDKLKIFLSAADIYITPYLDPQQITSGTLSYALGANKACISTKYAYAKDLLSNGKGILVPFCNSNAIANSLRNLYRNPKMLKRLEKSESRSKKEMQWSNVAKKHIKLYKDVLKRENMLFNSIKDYSSLTIEKTSNLPLLIPQFLPLPSIERDIINSQIFNNSVEKNNQKVLD